MTAIFITHNQDEALFMGDRVAVIIDGQLRQIGSPESVFNMPADSDVAAFVGVDTVIPGQVTDLDRWLCGYSSGWFAARSCW